MNGGEPVYGGNPMSGGQPSSPLDPMTGGERSGGLASGAGTSNVSGGESGGGPLSPVRPQGSSGANCAQSVNSSGMGCLLILLSLIYPYRRRREMS